MIFVTPIDTIQLSDELMVPLLVKPIARRLELVLGDCERERDPAVPVANDLVGEIEFLRVKPAVLLDMRFVVDARSAAVRLGARAAVSLPGTPLPGAVVTGNPIRATIASVQRAPVAPPRIAVVGGSLGARSLNEAVLGLYDRWRDRTDLTIHHVTGTRDYQGCSTKLAALRA